MVVGGGGKGCSSHHREESEKKGAEAQRAWHVFSLVIYVLQLSSTSHLSAPPNDDIMHNLSREQFDEARTLGIQSLPMSPSPGSPAHSTEACEGLSMLI